MFFQVRFHHFSSFVMRFLLSWDSARSCVPCLYVFAPLYITEWLWIIFFPSLSLSHSLSVWWFFGLLPMCVCVSVCVRAERVHAWECVRRAIVWKWSRKVQESHSHIFIIRCYIVNVYIFIRIYHVIFHKLDVVNTHTHIAQCTFDPALAIKRNKPDKQNSKNAWISVLLNYFESKTEYTTTHQPK